MEGGHQVSDEVVFPHTEQNVYGWFQKNGRPSRFDPADNPGGCACGVCGQPITFDLKSKAFQQLVDVQMDTSAGLPHLFYFFRAHADCWDKLPGAERRRRQYEFVEAPSGEPTSHTDQITCPKCGHEDKESWEWNEGGEDGDYGCPRCDADLRVSRHVSVTYSAKVKEAAK